MRKKEKIMILGITYLNNNLCNVTLLTSSNINCNDYKGYFVINKKTKIDLFYNFKNFGKWIDNKYFNLNDNYYIYLTPHNKTIFKNIRFPNGLTLGSCNQYQHQLIYKTENKRGTL